VKKLLLFMLLALPLAAQEKKEAAPEKDMTVWMWANFAILAGGLYYLSKKYGAPVFAAKAAGIQKDILDAEKTKSEADRKIAELNAKISNLGEEIEVMRADYQREQLRESERLAARHESEIARIHAQARQEIESATKMARLELQREAAALALHLAEGKVKARMTPQTRKELASAFVESIS
jgi:F-type H+-transporting ATPase subunit b